MAKQQYFYRTNGLLKRIKIDEVVLLQADNNYVKFYSMDGHFDLVRISLDAALAQLPAGQFTPVNRSFAIALEYLETIEKEFVTLTGVPDMQIPVSKKYYGDLIAEIKIIEAPTAYDY